MAASLALVLSIGALWVGTRPPDLGPDPSLQATPAPTLHVQTNDGKVCRLAALPPGPVTFRIDPSAPPAEQVVAVDVRGRSERVIWAEGFTGGTLDDPVVRDPAGAVVARDGEQFLLTPDDDRLHGYQVCAGSGNLYVLLFDREDPDVTPDPPAPPPTDLGILPGAWIVTAEAPIPTRSGHTAVRTGREMLVWGGETGAGDSSEGAAYDPIADTWRALSPAPIPDRYGHSAAWTGTEMIVWGGRDLRDTPRGDGAAYDPVADRWRVLASPPFALSGTQAIVWAHDELVVLDGAIRTDAIFTLNVASYRPATNDWFVRPSFRLPGVQAYSVAYTGSSGDVVLLLAATNGSSAWSLNRGSEDWRRLSDPPNLRLDSTDPEIFTGAEIVLPATVDGVDVVAALDSATEQWRIAMPPLGLGGGGNTWTGTLAFFGLGTGGMERRTVYDPTRDAWFGLPEAEGIHREFATQVWTGDRLLLWGGVVGESLYQSRAAMALVLDAHHAIAAHEFGGSGNDLRVEAFDASGSLTGVHAPSPSELGVIDFDDPREDGTLMRQLGPRAVLVHWTGGPGDSAARIEIRPDGRTIDLIAVPTYGDSIPFGRAIVLEFDRDIAVADLELVLWDGSRE